MLLDNFSPMTGTASPNRFGVVDGGKDQHGRAARGRVGGDGALPVGQTDGEGADHGWMRDRADPHARERAFAIAREEPPPGVSSEAAAVAVAEVLDGIGDACPECEITDSDS